MRLLQLDRRPRPVLVAAAVAAQTGAAGSENAVAAGVGTTEEATYVESAARDPDRLRIPALGVDAPVLAVEAPDRVLVPPRDPQRLGWWSTPATG